MEGAIYFVRVISRRLLGAVLAARASRRTLLSALTLGAVLTLWALVAVPIYNARPRRRSSISISLIKTPTHLVDALRPHGRTARYRSDDDVATLLIPYASVSIYLLISPL